ncbi:MAG: hypothetical protein WKG32_04340 [Gemmatimonadaceae bacterium]
MAERHNVTREGLIAGFIGATAVAVWFLIVDTVAGQPLHTPAVLGAALLDVLGPRGMEGSIAHVAIYTIFHFLMFSAVGVVVALIVHRAEDQPAILALLLVLFVVIEMGFYGLTAILSNSGILGELAWYQIGLANLIAAALMGTYMYRRHPALRQEFAHALGGEE